MFLYHTLPHVRNYNLKTEQPLTPVALDLLGEALKASLRRRGVPRRLRGPPRPGPSLPMPLLAPVTRATVPLSSSLIGFLRSVGSPPTSVLARRCRPQLGAKVFRHCLGPQPVAGVVGWNRSRAKYVAGCARNAGPVFPAMSTTPPWGPGREWRTSVSSDRPRQPATAAGAAPGGAAHPCRAPQDHDPPDDDGSRRAPARSHAGRRPGT